MGAFVHHTAMTVGNLDRMVSFHCGLLGGQVVLENAWGPGNAPLNRRLGLAESAARLAIVGFGNQFIEFLEFDRPRPARRSGPPSVATPGLTHICFQVENCQTEYARLRAAGVEFHASPRDADRSRVHLWPGSGRQPFRTDRNSTRRGISAGRNHAGS